MNDIEKLHKVINTLEEQSTHVSKFNGLLSAVNATREQIESANKQLINQVTAQEESIASTKIYFEQIGTRLSDLESKILEFKFVTPDQYEQGLSSTEQLVERQIYALTDKVNKALDAQQSTIKSLRTIVVFGFLILASGIAFLIKSSSL